MKIEYEATFPNIDKSAMRERLILAGARLVKPESLLKRNVYRLPAGHELEGGFLRVRDEGDKVTMSLKVIKECGIEDQQEICLTVDDFIQASEFLNAIGCEAKSYQETRREVWELDGVEVDLDEWPFLEPFVEIEGESEEEVVATCEKLGLDYGDAKFCSAGKLYSEKYGLPLELINNQVTLINFEMENPFLKLDNKPDDSL